MKEEIFKLNYHSYRVAVHYNSSTYPFSHPSATSVSEDGDEIDTESFFDEEDDYETKKIRPISLPIFNENYTSNLEEEYLSNYGNPMASVEKNYSMVLVERNGDKLSIKLFHGYRRRYVGKTWFRTSKNVDYITVNTKTGDVYSGFLQNYQSKKKCKKKIEKNFFVTQPVNSFMIKIRNRVWSFVHNHSEVTLSSLSKFISEIDGGNVFNQLNFEQRLFKFYLDKKRIKYPNNFYLYAKKFYGPEFRKELKRNDNRLVDTIMSLNGYSGKSVKKALHICSDLNLELYNRARKLFGDDWINQDENFIVKTLNCEVTSGNRGFPVEFVNLVSREELRRVFRIFKKVFFDLQLDFFTFLDHISMYTELKMFGETDLKWLSDDTDRKKFTEEHRDWSDKLSFYKTGKYTRIYPEFIYDILEQPLDGYYPVVLDDSMSYNNESSVQSNCVKTYIGKPGSLIVSIRRGSRDSEERATVEYFLYKQNDLLKFKRIQSLGKFNGKLDENWGQPLLKLDTRMLYYINDKRFEPVKLKKETSTGKVLESDSIFSSDGSLRWFYDGIEKTPSTIFEWL